MTDKQTKILLYVIVFLIVLFTIYFSLLFAISNRKSNTNENNGLSKQIEKVSEQTDAQNINRVYANADKDGNIRYMLKSSEENVYIYKIYADGSKEKVKQVNINTKYMRELDRKSLEKGITVKNNEELLCLIEDFSS